MVRMGFAWAANATVTSATPMTSLNVFVLGSATSGVAGTAPIKFGGPLSISPVCE
jgi:hypothetical protein